VRFPAGRVLWFFVKFMVLFCLLAIPQWPRLGRVYAAAYCTCCNWFFHSFGDNGRVRYEPVGTVQARIAQLQAVQQSLRQTLGREPALVEIARDAGSDVAEAQRLVDISRQRQFHEADSDWGVVMHLANKRTGATMDTMGSTRFHGFQPTAFVIALTLATPIPWKRRLKALALALVLVSLFVGLRAYVFLNFLFTPQPDVPAGIAVYNPGKSLTFLIRYFNWVIVQSFAGCFVLAGCLWFLATFRRSDWSVILGPLNQKEAGQEPGPTGG
jgi:hypothetical protein